ncbi:hypothetical protein [Methylorubrum sp. SB2]|uniref:hypothetical protein n=1 Tax=Methylorubrum subtropicum TaxID=3138812 RepID=UPI00313AE426
MSTPAAGDGILMHLERLIAALESRTSEQTSEVMALVEAGAESRDAEEALWRNVDNLLALRRHQLRTIEMFLGTGLDAQR